MKPSSSINPDYSVNQVYMLMAYSKYSYSLVMRYIYEDRRTHNELEIADFSVLLRSQ
jgi:hypothetical protein